MTEKPLKNRGATKGNESESLILHIKEFIHEYLNAVDYICGKEPSSLYSSKDELKIKVLLMDEDSGSVFGRFLEHCTLHNNVERLLMDQSNSELYDQKEKHNHLYKQGTNFLFKMQSFNLKAQKKSKVFMDRGIQKYQSLKPYLIGKVIHCNDETIIVLLFSF
ncbi:hypothetical protein E5288_WYG015246 [Bos mutus]|uniref:Uncharacterized protein n=1 Tax=Bos mutus TaxID=72004 RepID=A0A6B0RZC4_9CETA|nr:hypothetical protein [Bos mutus]